MTQKRIKVNFEHNAPFIDQTEEIQQIVYYKGYIILIYNDGFRLVKNVCYSGYKSNLENQLKEATQLIDEDVKNEELQADILETYRQFYDNMMTAKKSINKLNEIINKMDIKQ